jgi:hypothetical protein
MVTALCREWRVIALAMTASGWAVGIASAQTAHQPQMTTQTLSGIKARVPVGDVVYVTDTTGTTIKGRLTALTDEAVHVKVRAGVRGVAAADVRRIQWQQPDSPLTGALIGAGVGAIPGIYWLAVDPNECTGMCPEEYAFIAVGAVVGALIDRAIKRKMTVYSAAASRDGAKSFVIGPLVTRDHKGVQIAVKF